ncbi:hypothetical protein AUP42_04580 [Thalassospira lucentensis]|uniref:Putative endonuclease Z1 domain-containing protein n=1 Tax=Thalassospira lucentensis TaxID=168935 RepID=A0A154L250_9PROT|nr:Z1 domain-containing protein [Thalassospira lucentensis]KZB62232.1 hypothetical protein AUP42_04580 [Thalassospira lucentensis]
MQGFYARLRDKRKDDDSLAECIERVVNQLEKVSTSGDRPGMLLGKIQSGKTRGFVGVIARAFDRGFDIAIVLTKGTKTLSAQTVARLSSDFDEFIDEDELLVLDIMKLPGRLTKSELGRKVVVVAKKQTKNLERLISFMENHEALHGRKVLLVDDEADLASVRFVRKQGKGDIEQGKIADQMDEIRRMTDKGVAFLQVTATPYSLYLQPEGYENINSNNFVFKPKKPAFTELLPIHSGYIGGDDYFGGHLEDDPRHYLIVDVDANEQDALRKADKRRIHPDKVFESPNTAGLRRAIVTFVVAVCVRRWQQSEMGEKRQKYAMIIHNDTQKSAHSWQEQVIDWIFNSLIEKAESDPASLKPLFREAYDDLYASVGADKGRMPSEDVSFTQFIEAILSDSFVKETVNSDKDVMNLLDEKAELKLRTPFNIYVGGNILDRGITIPNLISFYYGRNPRMMQADTVLQHSRMYGARKRSDLAVTRFYTSDDVYNRLYTINEFENALREAFETGAHDCGVVFIQTDADRKVRPCAPNKIQLSDVVAIRPNGILLPTGFNVQTGQKMVNLQKRLNDLIRDEWRDSHDLVALNRDSAFEIIDLCQKTMKFPISEFEWDAMKGLIDYFSDVAGQSDELFLLAETGRKLGREKSGDKSGLSILGPALRNRVVDPGSKKCVLVMLQQQGDVDKGWGGTPFWWPILIAPGNIEPCVFARKTAK